mmetsp:Transcript_95206/g.308263  ORF Transcript_95206/g.308263 Transcript_95206/m.308263 type:complete len:289 (-) Transcript_95206:8-874(-)
MMRCWSSIGKPRKSVAPSSPNHFLLDEMNTSTSCAAASSHGFSPSCRLEATSWPGTASATAKCTPSAASTTSKDTSSLGLKSLPSNSGLYAVKNTKLPSKENDCTCPQPRCSTAALGCINHPSTRPAPTQFATGNSELVVTIPSSMSPLTALPLPLPFAEATTGATLLDAAGASEGDVGSGSATVLTCNGQPGVNSKPFSCAATTPAAPAAAKRATATFLAASSGSRCSVRHSGVWPAPSTTACKSSSSAQEGHPRSSTDGISAPATGGTCHQHLPVSGPPKGTRARD